MTTHPLRGYTMCAVESHRPGLDLTDQPGLWVSQV